MDLLVLQTRFVYLSVNVHTVYCITRMDEQSVSVCRCFFFFFSACCSTCDRFAVHYIRHCFLGCCTCSNVSFLE